MSDRVTLRDIYERFDRLEDKLDRRFIRLENKVELLETFRDRAYGMIAVVGTFSGIIASYIWKKIFRD